jgi:hypothetical protein
MELIVQDHKVLVTEDSIIVICEAHQTCDEEIIENIVKETQNILEDQ